ncbi:helix-turn-helix transcriptional regulator, partial [Streptomyces sp. NPDC021139]
AADARRPGGLSPRELQVLAELTTGRTNREIAERLYITPRTVGTHIEHILAKLGLPNRAAAAARAAAWGITDRPPHRSGPSRFG